MTFGIDAVHWRDRRNCNEWFEGEQAHTGYDYKQTVGKFKDNWIGKWIRFLFSFTLLVYIIKLQPLIIEWTRPSL